MVAGGYLQHNNLAISTDFVIFETGQVSQIPTADNKYHYLSMSLRCKNNHVDPINVYLCRKPFGFPTISVFVSLQHLLELGEQWKIHTELVCPFRKFAMLSKA